jgi:hypothetical protein
MYDILVFVAIVMLVYITHYFYFKKNFRKKYTSNTEFKRAFFYSLFDNEQDPTIYAKLRTDEAKAFYRSRFSYFLLALGSLLVLVVSLPFIFFTPLFSIFIKHPVMSLGTIFALPIGCSLYYFFMVKKARDIDQEIMKKRIRC